MNELTEGIGSLSDLVKQDLPNPSDVEIEYNQETRNMTRSKLLEDYGYIIDNLREKERRMNTEFHNIEQILGAALGFPWFKDDQKNFPNATEADGVCVGDHTAWSLALMAADKIKDLPKINSSDKIVVSQTEDKFFILKNQKHLLELDKKHLADLIDALIELQNI
jgi:methionine aminopeptidase